MAQTLTAPVPAGIGVSAKLKIAILKLTNSAAETAFTLTAALAGMTGIAVVLVMDQTAAATMRGNPTALDSISGLFASVALTFTAGDTLTLVVIGV